VQYQCYEAGEVKARQTPDLGFGLGLRLSHHEGRSAGVKWQPVCGVQVSTVRKVGYGYGYGVAYIQSVAGSRRCSR